MNTQIYSLLKPKTNTHEPFNSRIIFKQTKFSLKIILDWNKINNTFVPPKQEQILEIVYTNSLVSRTMLLKSKNSHHWHQKNCNWGDLDLKGKGRLGGFYKEESKWNCEGRERLKKEMFIKVCEKNWITSFNWNYVTSYYSNSLLQFPQKFGKNFLMSFWIWLKLWEKWETQN